MLSIFIACLGLFGLASFELQQKTKEIDIRKVLWESPAAIVCILSKRIVMPVLIAALLAFPFAWWAMHQWLQGFAYRTNAGWWVFALSGFMALLVALATISIKVLKVAMVNSSKILRSE